MNRTDIVIGLQQMTGKAMPKRLGGGATLTIFVGAVLEGLSFRLKYSG